jgi:hypothetical protein
MELNHIADFLAGSVGVEKKHWSSQGVASMAARALPDGLLGIRSAILRADINLLWARWFIESICGPSFGVQAQRGYAFVLGAVREQIDIRFSDYPSDERSGLARVMARFVLEETNQLKQERQPLSREDKLNLLDAAGEPPRCWMCGYAFDEFAVESFLMSLPRALPLKTFVDFMKPRLRQRDYAIEVDHMVPFSAGGGGDANLALSCGWCNKAKGARLSLYDVQARPLTFEHPTLGLTSVPRAFWTVRILALRKRCEYEACGVGAANGELSAIPRNPHGAMNPMNLMVTCPDHDPLGADRLVHRKYFENIEI